MVIAQMRMNDDHTRVRIERIDSAHHYDRNRFNRFSELVRWNGMNRWENWSGPGTGAWWAPALNSFVKEFFFRNHHSQPRNEIRSFEIHTHGAVHCHRSIHTFAPIRLHVCVCVIRVWESTFLSSGQHVHRIQFIIYVMRSMYVNKLHNSHRFFNQWAKNLN